jgi:hypothetical protein
MRTDFSDSKTPHALADSLMIVFQHSAKVNRLTCRYIDIGS